MTEIDTLLDQHTEAEIAALLNARGRVSGTGQPFHPALVQKIRKAYGLRSRYDRLREAGLLTLRDIAALLSVSTGTVKTWRDRGLLRAHVYNDKHECLYEHPGASPPVKAQGHKLADRRQFPQVAANPTQEVQYEA